nr:hypothetical transcript [Hymenolepis microstoma]
MIISDNCNSGRNACGIVGIGEDMEELRPVVVVETIGEQSDDHPILQDQNSCTSCLLDSEAAISSAQNTLSSGNWQQIHHAKQKMAPIIEKNITKPVKARYTTAGIDVQLTHIRLATKKNEKQASMGYSTLVMVSLIV